MLTDKYRVFYVRGSPAVAVPVGPQIIRLAAVRRIHGYTPKRLLFRSALWAAIASKVDGHVGEIRSNPLDWLVDYSFNEWLASHAHTLGLNVAGAVVLWHWTPTFERGRGRSYVHLLDENGQPVAFIKVSSKEAFDHALSHEGSFLARLDETSMGRAKPPNILGTGVLPDGHRYLTMEAVPASARPVPARLGAFPEDVVAAIRGRTQVLDTPDKEPWWPTAVYGETTDRLAFASSLTKLAEQHPVRVSRVHGDFESKNLCYHATRMWILDWEDASHSGPYLTDSVRYFLASNLREVSRRPQKVLKGLLNWHGSSGDTRCQLDVGLALSYLSKVGSPEATALINQW